MSSEPGSYLWDIVSGGFKVEDRLTNIFCSSFNESVYFKKLFFEFVRHPINLNLKADARPYDQVSGWKPDVYIEDKAHNLKIVLENKIDAPLTYNQLKKYHKEIDRVKNLNRKYRIALVKDYFEKPNENWEVKHWSEFYYFIVTSKLYRDREKFEDNSKEYFVIDNFLNYLKNNNMATPHHITRKDLIDLNNIFHKHSCSIKSKPVFFTASNYISMVEGIVNKAKEIKVLRKAIGKNFQFNPNFSRDWYTVDDRNNERLKYPGISIHISLYKPFKEIKSLGTGLFFVKKGKYEVNSYVRDSKGDYSDGIYFTGDLKFEEYRNKTLKYWMKKLGIRKRQL